MIKTQPFVSPSAPLLSTTQATHFAAVELFVVDYIYCRALQTVISMYNQLTININVQNTLKLRLVLKLLDLILFVLKKFVFLYNLDFKFILQIEEKRNKFLKPTYTIFQQIYAAFYQLNLICLISNQSSIAYNLYILCLFI